MDHLTLGISACSHCHVESCTEHYEPKDEPALVLEYLQHPPQYLDLGFSHFHIHKENVHPYFLNSMTIVLSIWGLVWNHLAMKVRIGRWGIRRQ
jgi:hypothetical protein